MKEPFVIYYGLILILRKKSNNTFSFRKIQ